MNTNESTTPTTARRPKQYGFQPSPYADKKPVTMRLSKEARDLLDAEARSENTSVTELVEQIVRQRTLRFPDGEKLSVVDFPVDKSETQRSLDNARAEIARLQATASEIKPQTALIAPVIEKKLPPRPTVEGLYPGWTDKKKKRWDTDTYKHKQWCLDVTEEILDMIYGKT